MIKRSRFLVTGAMVIAMSIGYMTVAKAAEAIIASVGTELTCQAVQKGIEKGKEWQDAKKQATDRSFANENASKCPVLFANSLKKWVCASGLSIGHNQSKFKYTSNFAGPKCTKQNTGFGKKGMARKFLQSLCDKKFYTSTNQGEQMVNNTCTYEYHLGSKTYQFTLTATNK